MKIRALAAAIAPAAFILISHPPVATAAPAPTCLGHRATIVGTSGHDVIHGTSHADVIVAKGGRDTIYGGGGNDIICAGGGDDTVYGGRGSDDVLPRRRHW